MGRIVPTGKRRRQKFGKSQNEEENNEDIENNNVPEEEDRRSDTSAPRRKLNRLPGQFTSRRKTTNPTEVPITRIPLRRRLRPLSFGNDQETIDFETESPQIFIDEDEDSSFETFPTTNKNGISVLPISTDDVSKILPPGFVLPKDENESLQTEPTTSTQASTLTTRRTPITAKAVTKTATTTTSTTTVQTTTTSQPFKFTPLPTEPTTPRVYVSTSNFRPTLPTLEPEEQTASEIVVVETSSIGNLNQPLVLAPQNDESDKSVSSLKSVVKAASTTQGKSGKRSTVFINNHHHNYSNNYNY